MYVFSFLDEVGLLYAVYTLWFNDNGATTAEISGLFLFWAIVAIVLEVPSGALADRVDRRLVVALALGLRAIGVVGHTPGRSGRGNPNPVIGLLLGGEVSARWHRPNPRWLGLGLVGSMIITALAFITDAVWSLGLVAVGYAALQLASVNADARLQERTAGATRATVTSVAAFGGSSMSMLMFVVIAVLADGDDPSLGILIAVAGLAVAGWLVALWLPSARPFDPMLEGDLR